MKRKSKIEITSTKQFEGSLLQSTNGNYLLHLYVTGSTPNSIRAIDNIKKICEEHLKGRYELDVVDLYLKPNLAKGEQIIAAPTLIRKQPLPLRRFIGDLSDTDRVLIGLDLGKK